MEVTRIFDLLDWMVENHPREDALAGKRNGEWIRYSTADYYKYSHLLAYGLYELGVRKGDKIVSVTNNRPEWNFLDMATAMLGAVHIPVYPTLNADNYLYILNHSEAQFLFTGNLVNLRRVLPAWEKMETKPQLITFDRIEGYRNVSEVFDLGIANKAKDEPVVNEIKNSVQPDDLFSIAYTSGTTGESKGVMLSHRNLVFNFIGHADVQVITENDKMLSFLPLNHIYERSMVYEYQYIGSAVYYAESIGTIQSNMAEIHADGFCSVPRIIETIAEKFLAAGRDLPFLSRNVYALAIKHGYKYKWGHSSLWYDLWQNFFDAIVYRKWRAKLGGHRLTIVSGGSAIQQRIVRLFNAAGMNIYEGYGMTEAAPVIAVNNPADGRVRLGTVGPALAGTEIKIAEDGEILTRGPHVMLGYYKDEAYTKEVIDKDGFLHTGDIGELVDGYYLKITDRKKEIFKLSAGKYVAPQMIENMLKGSSLIEQVMVVGENEKFASALVVPNFHALHAWADRNKIHYRDNATLIAIPEVHALYQKAIDAINAELAPHEQIKRFRMVADEWTMQNGFLSPTLKLKRSVLFKQYKDIIDEIYNKAESSPVKSDSSTPDVSNVSFDILNNLKFRTPAFNKKDRLARREARRLKQEKKRRIKEEERARRRKVQEQERQKKAERKALEKASRADRKLHKPEYTARLRALKDAQEEERFKLKEAIREERIKQRKRRRVLRLGQKQARRTERRQQRKERRQQRFYRRQQRRCQRRDRKNLRRYQRQQRKMIRRDLRQRQREERRQLQ